jgi:hypothetical protein
MNSRDKQVSEAKPYKGTESYQIEDDGLFFGRDGDSDQLIAQILSSRLTLLHAQSGAGKTSLLNARVIPGLEARGWSAFRIIPQNDPIESVRTTALRHVLPHPDAEYQAMMRALKSLGNGADGLRLGELLERFDSLEIRDERRRTLAAHVELRVDTIPNNSNNTGLWYPYFCRLLRSDIEADTFWEHLNAVSPTPRVTSETALQSLLGVLSERGFLYEYNRLLNELNVPGRHLSVFFEHLFECYGRRRSDLGLVLIMDQFEELFTRFIDPGAAGPEYLRELPDWRLKYEFFRELETLRTATPSRSMTEATDGTSTMQPALPLRLVISMRDEYIAHLSGIRLKENSYHLNLLETGQAIEAIKKPAAIFGYKYEGDCLEGIILQLTKEERFVEPAHLQLVCEKLWTEQGRDLANLPTNGEIPSIALRTFESLGGTKGILRSFLRDFLEGLPHTERREMLEMLEPLITTSGTRNIIERERLVRSPFRDENRRRDLLNKLVDRTIVRTEPRLGGYFVEITHEFLIPPILESIRELWGADPSYSRYRVALRTLERLRGSNIAGTNPPLSRQEFDILHEHRQTIRWDGWSTELMLRSAIAYNVAKEVLSIWLGEFQTYEPSVMATPLFAARESSIQEAQVEILSLAELRRVNKDRESFLNLSPEQLLLVWRSQLSWADDAERKDVVYWTERMKA